MFLMVIWDILAALYKTLLTIKVTYAVHQTHHNSNGWRCLAIDMHLICFSRNSEVNQLHVRSKLDQLKCLNNIYLLVILMTRKGNPICLHTIRSSIEETVDFVKCITRDSETIETNWI
jgi:hypothetical protein